MPIYLVDSRKASPSADQCSLCGEEYTNFGHNAWPFPGRCCDDCNERYVNPARLTRFRKWVARSERKRITE
jgi:hypothetical protein